MAEENQQKSNSNFWITVLAMVEFIIIIIMFATKNASPYFFTFLIGLGLLFGIYKLVEMWIMKVNIHRLIDVIRAEELKKTGLKLDIGYTDNVPNVQVSRIGDEYLVYFFKENITYSYNFKDGVYSRVNRNLLTEEDKIIQNKVLINHILEEKRKRILEESGQDIVKRQVA